MSTPGPDLDAPDEESDYDVEFTTEHANANVVICKRCSKKFPSGTKLKLMHSNIQGGSDRFFCSKCFDYYRNKNTTIRRMTQTQRPLAGTSNQGTTNLRHNLIFLRRISHLYFKKLKQLVLT
jgi:hypothetical protein